MSSVRQWLLLDLFSSMIIASSFLYIGVLERLVSLIISGEYFAAWSLFSGTAFFRSNNVSQEKQLPDTRRIGWVVHSISLLGVLIVAIYMSSYRYDFVEFRALLDNLVRAPPYYQFSFIGIVSVVIIGTSKLLVSRLIHHLNKPSNERRYIRDANIDILPVSTSIMAVVAYRYWGVRIVDILLAVVLPFAVEIIFKSKSSNKQ